MRRSSCLSVILGSFLLTGLSHALEPVEPQPATPLTFSDPAYQTVIQSVAKEMIADGVVVIDVRSPIERIKEGFIKRTPRGREVTDLAYKHLGRNRYNSQASLFGDS